MAKNETNLVAGRPDFTIIEEFDWETAVVLPSHRGVETRWTALGLVGDRLYHVVFTERGERTRIISLRLASRRERDRYVQSRT